MKGKRNILRKQHRANEESIRTGSASSGPKQATKDDDPATHRNEGFLKSMWHNLTNHPAHHDSTSHPDTEGKKDDENSSGSKNEESK